MVVDSSRNNSWIPCAIKGGGGDQGVGGRMGFRWGLTYKHVTFVPLVVVGWVGGMEEQQT